jgi:ATP-dependent RNA circularization protein (DNA/RNA ligase family)
MTKEELYNEVWRLWEDMQLDILIEEMSELTQAIIKARRHNMVWNFAVFEEIADVMICLEIVGTRLKALPTDIDRKTNLPTGYLFDIVEEAKVRKIARLEERVYVAKNLAKR